MADYPSRRRFRTVEPIGVQTRCIGTSALRRGRRGVAVGRVQIVAADSLLRSCGRTMNTRLDTRDAPSHSLTIELRDVVREYRVGGQNVRALDEISLRFE